MSTYYAYHDVKMNIAHRLMESDGWTVYGYSARESDPYTDYYFEGYWDGIATKNGFTLVIDKNSAKEAYTETRTIYSPNNNEYTDKINKLMQMTQERGASEAEEATARAMIEKLQNKRTSEETTKEIYHPGHLANPPRCNWHIEKDGVIYDKGTGILKFANVPDITSDREREDWQKFNNQTPEEWQAKTAKEYMYRWNDNEERAKECAKEAYQEAAQKYELLNKFNELLARFNNVCGGSVGNTEAGYYTYEQVKETKYKKELKPQKAENGEVKEGQCFILVNDFNYGCRRGYVYRIHATTYEDKNGETVTSYDAYRLGKGYKKERTGMTTNSNHWYIGTDPERITKWIDKGSISWCELVEVSTPYEVTKTIKKHIVPETSETTQTTPENAETTTGEEETEATQEAATEGAQTARDTATSDTDNQGEQEKEESEETTDREEKADTSENKADNNGDMFATLAAAYLSGRTVKSKKKAVEKEKAQKTDKSTADAEKANTGKNEAMQDMTPEFCTPDGENGKLFCEIIRNDKKILVYATKESDSSFEVVAVSTDSDICEKQRTTTAADARRAFYEYCEMWTPSTAKENAGEITSDILTDEEIKRITKGEQVQHIQETQYGNHITAYFATRYTDKTHLVFTLSNICKEDHIAPGHNATYCGFITGGKLYTDTAAITKAINTDVENHIRKSIPDEMTAERLIDYEKENRYSLRELTYIASKDYMKEARKLFFDGNKYNLQLYSHINKYSTETLIAYTEKPEQTIEEIASAYMATSAIKIFVEYVNRNRTTAALKAIKATSEDEAHKIKAIADCVDDQKTVRIEMDNGKTVKAEANAIKYLPHRGNISEYYIVASDRDKLPKNKYNRPDDIKPEQIKAIYHGQRTLYKAKQAV